MAVRVRDLRQHIRSEFRDRPALSSGIFGLSPTHAAAILMPVRRRSLAIIWTLVDDRLEGVECFAQIKRFCFARRQVNLLTVL